MVDLILGDCIPIMADLTGPYDMILADLPYGTTACKWDTVIPFAPLWEQYKRLIKRKGAVVLFGSQPFTSALVMSNVEWFKYEWVWRKNKGTGHLNAKIMPMRAHENIVVFGEPMLNYTPQMRKGEPYQRIDGSRAALNKGCYGQTNDTHSTINETGDRYPLTVLDFAVVERTLHPTQKPVALLEYLIRTYTNEGETVVDNTMGSGSTGVACVNTGRGFTGIEMDAGYFEIAQQRIEKAQTEMVQLSFSQEA